MRLIGTDEPIFIASEPRARYWELSKHWPKRHLTPVTFTDSATHALLTKIQNELRQMLELEGAEIRAASIKHLLREVFGEYR